MLSSVIRKNSRIVEAHNASMVVPNACIDSLCRTIPHKRMPYKRFSSSEVDSWSFPSALGITPRLHECKSNQSKERNIGK